MTLGWSRRRVRYRRIQPVVLVLNELSRATEDEMRGIEKTGLFIAAAAVAASAACGNRHTADDGLARDLSAVGSASSDLQLTPRGGTSQTVVSAIEAGPTSAPKRTAAKPAAKPVSHPAPPRAAPQRTVPPPVTVVQSAPAPQQAAPAPQEKPAEPPPLPPFPDAQGKGRDRGSITEAQIFQRMPWIRP